MWHEMSEFFSIMTAVIFAALSIKLVDDYLDQDIDTKNFATILGNGTAVYALLFYAFAAAINSNVSLGLFLASYALGMFNDLKSIFPSRLSGWQEIIIVIAIGAYFLTFKDIFFYLTFVLVVQLVDDLIDIKQDASAGHRNLVYKLGMLESVVICILNLCLCWWLNQKLIYPILLGTVITYTGTFYLSRRL